MRQEAEHPVVLVRDLHARRGLSVVLDGIDLTLRRGETVAVQGSSGTGKSTLLAAIAGLSEVESGEIVVDGNPMVGVSDRSRSATRLRSIGMAFQSDELLPELTLGENVSLPLRMGGRRWSKSDVGTAVAGVLARLGIEDLGDRLPAEVSGGQLQRAAIARAIVHDPAVVLADEPTGALDDETARLTVQLLVELASDRDAAVIVVTHDADVARACDRRVYLDAGRLSEQPGETQTAGG
ncbi:ABC transporter ATP-binding protein [Aeromicrobium sp.]|uniref:ABC transporter ATP-binding protein n=1 Tax=Aeromicrobium sp. TaxID=1871063 RepID=UPI0030C40FD8